MFKHKVTKTSHANKELSFRQTFGPQAAPQSLKENLKTFLFTTFYEMS